MQNEVSRTAPAASSRGRWGALLKNNKDAKLIAFLFILTFVLRVAASARAVTFSDSGDFLMGIATVGNIHGPGYPLYLMTAKLFSWIVPFGSLAFRVSLFSAAFAAITTCLVYWIIFRMAHSRAAGVVAGLAYSFSYTFFYQSVIPETYSLNTLFIAMLIVLALRWERMLGAGRRQSADNAMCLFALFLGLALCNHFSVIFILPAFIFFALDTSWRDALAPRNLLRMIAFLAIGLLPYLYEPAAAFRGPAYNYGDPSTPVRWFHHMTVYYQRGGLLDYPYQFLPARFWRYFGTLKTEFPYFWWLGAIGFLASFRKRSKKYPLFLIFLFLLTLVPVMTYSQIEPVLRAHFYYESYLVFTLWIGFGAAFLFRLVKLWTSRADRLVEHAALFIVVALVLLCPLSAVIVHYNKVDKSNYFYARDMAKSMLETAERDSVIVVADDNVIFPTMYMQIVEGLRTDVRIVSAISAGVPGFRGKDLLVYTPRGYVAKPGSDNYTQLFERNSGRLPIYSTDPTIVKPEWKQYWLGFLVRVYPAGVDPQQPDTVGPSQLPGATSPAFKDGDARWAILLPQSLKANTLYAVRDYRAAEEIYDKTIPEFQKDLYVPTLYSSGTYSELYELWGSVLNLQRKFKDTVRNLPSALAIDPDFYSIALAKAYSALGEYTSALDQLYRYATYQPHLASALADIGEVYIFLQDYPKAAQKLQEAIRMDPNSPRTHLLFGRTLYLQGHPKKAIAEFETVIKLDPAGDWGQYARESIRRAEDK